jgi:serine/threonine protein kinase
MTGPKTGSSLFDGLERYRLGPVIGRGAMGEVYRARDLSLDRDVAIKMLPHDLASDERRIARLLREGQLLAKLSHPHIVCGNGTRWS